MTIAEPATYTPTEEQRLRAASFLSQADRLFSNGAEMLRESRSKFAAGAKHEAFMLHRTAMGAFQSSRALYGRALGQNPSVHSPRIERRVGAILRVAEVSMSSLEPLPFPGCQTSGFCPEFRQSELLRRGRVERCRARICAAFSWIAGASGRTPWLSL
jgi:hypothetical protein